MCTRLVRYVQHSGLVCGSYGSQSNIPENAKVSVSILILSVFKLRYENCLIANTKSEAQVAAATCIIMANRVGLIAMSLKGYHHIKSNHKSQA